jgi:hypothetical protein
MLSPKMLFRWLWAASALAVGVAAAQERELAAGRAAWRAAALESYEYGYRKFCECHPDSPPETLVTVRDRQVVAVRHRPFGFTNEVPAPRPEENLQYYWTIDGLFDLVAAGLKRGATVRATYDPTLGYPAEVYIDYDPNFIGDELDVRLTTVAPLSQ